jgi:D-alanyl-D-alanine carboxypeptidase/D-alanyl-D-alanine-endopeptidase (penicillin-binding protein 4)
LWLLLVAPPIMAATPHALPPEVDAALKRARIPPEAVSIVVQATPAAGTGDAGSTGGSIRLALNERVPVNPASLFKLATTAAAIDLLGPAFTWSTPVWLLGPVRDGVLDGSLVIKGNGDPKLVLERVWLLLRRVRALGVHEIRGDIVLDRSAFAVPAVAPGDFDGEPFRPYNVSADALLINYKSIVLTFTPDAARGIAAVTAEPPLAGVVIDAAVPLLMPAAPCNDWRAALKAEFADPRRVNFAGVYAPSCGERVWPVAYADPASYNARAIEALWRELGGGLQGTVREGLAPVDVTPTFESVSPPLSEVVRDINKFSNNVMAQQLFLTLGLTLRGAGTPEAARDVVNRWLDERFGHDASGVVVQNGSGLSRDARVSAALLARLLQWAWTSPSMPELVASLPAAGVDGTLRRSKAPTGRAHLKTGSLRDVAGVAGIVHGLSGQRWVLVAIVNHADVSGDDLRAVFDALIRWTANDVMPPR